MTSTEDEWRPYEVHDLVNPSNPIELPIEVDALVATLDQDIRRLQSVLDSPAVDAEFRTAGEVLIKRRTRFRQWVLEQPGGPFIGIYPAFSDPIHEREDVVLSEEVEDRPYIIFWRWRRALLDDHAHWAERETHPMTQYGKDLLTGFQRWGKAAMEAADTLRYRPELDAIPLHTGETVPVDKETWASMARSYYTMPYLSLLLSERAHTMTIQAAFRVAEILQFVIEQQPSAAVSAFLERLAKLYIWGFDSETYVLARSVLEAALKQRFPDESVRRASGSDRRYPDLSERITAAANLGIFTSAERRLATSLRRDGNDVIHEFPNLNLNFKSPLEAIDAVGRLLEKLVDDPVDSR